MYSTDGVKRGVGMMDNQGCTWVVVVVVYVTEGRLRWKRILYRIKLRRLFPLLAEIQLETARFEPWTFREPV